MAYSLANPNFGLCYFASSLAPRQCASSYVACADLGLD